MSPAPAPRTAVDSTTSDVIVIGAGVAGLAAARTLRASGKRILVLEARDRIGGRIFTMRDARLPVPVELGAEFLHGVAAETDAVVREAGLAVCDIVGERWQSSGRTLTRLHDYFKRLDHVLRHLDPKRTPDRSLAAFLADEPGGPTHGRERSLARQFVEGFHAADPERISERALADGGNPGEDPDEQRIARVLSGYDRVPAALAESIGDAIRLGSVVDLVEWTAGHVRVHVRAGDGGARRTHEARAAIITVPLGVLQAGMAAGAEDDDRALRFSPSLDAPDESSHGAAVRGMAMGAVIRVVVLCREPFWMSLRTTALPAHASLRALAFLHGTGAEFPIWWTMYPVRAPVLVGWMGGPHATALANASAQEIEDKAISALARNLVVSRRRVASMVEACWTHDWLRDPFARGAYSYPVVGGSTAAKRLARPLQDTLFFAGEAATKEGRNGTVDGAIASGLHAAHAVAATLT